MTSPVKPSDAAPAEPGGTLPPRPWVMLGVDGETAVLESVRDLLQQAMEQLSLSDRAYDRILKVARTITDLPGQERTEDPYFLEALQYGSPHRPVLY